MRIFGDPNAGRYMQHQRADRINLRQQINQLAGDLHGGFQSNADELCQESTAPTAYAGVRAK